MSDKASAVASAAQEAFHQVGPQIQRFSAAARSFFSTKNEDLKNMLEGNNQKEKLDAMRKIIAEVAKGHDMVDLFPSVVKSVVSPSVEIKKLVYAYLIRYAEQQQDLALLSINTFQKDLRDSNQLIRASALRVMSSIRVEVIVPLVMLAIKQAAGDMSPYVRKHAAYAIPKLYQLDSEEKDSLIEVIQKLLQDSTTIVLGSAVMAFDAVCPERYDLIHPQFKKLCTVLMDVDEWGQLAILNMLLRYSRTQFLDPNGQDNVASSFSPSNSSSSAKKSASFYSDEDDSDNDDNQKKDKKKGSSSNKKMAEDDDDEDDDEEGDDDDDEDDGSKKNGKKLKSKSYVMDQDHRLLLRSALPLLQSRNSAVVMAVAQLYYYLAPSSEANIVGKALVRLLHSHREIQYVVLSNAAVMSALKPAMFETYLKNFFIRSTDPTFLRLLKLDILGNLASDSNADTILKELQTYVKSTDKKFVLASIQTIGRCASGIPDIRGQCLQSLMGLIQNRNEDVVAESVVVLKKLLQLSPKESKSYIASLVKLIDKVTVPMARASILWLVGEYSEFVPKFAPDVLRKLAQSFMNEETIVKLQVLTLGAKLFISNSQQTRLLFQYVLNLAKYDMIYDIRDRGRMLEKLLVSKSGSENLRKAAKEILLSEKPAPNLVPSKEERVRFHLGSLSHVVGRRIEGYSDLPNFPETQPDPSVRVVVTVTDWNKNGKNDGKSTDGKKSSKSKAAAKKESFYSDSEDSDEGDFESIEGSDSEGLDSANEDEDEDEDEDDDEDEVDDDDEDDEDEDDEDDEDDENDENDDDDDDEEEGSELESEDASEDEDEEDEDDDEEESEDSEEDRKKKTSALKKKK